MTILAILALVVSSIMLAVIVTVLVLLRKGEGPTYSTSRQYDANRREAVRVLTGRSVDAVPTEQWYDPARRHVLEDDPLAEPFRAAVGRALSAVVPTRHGPVREQEGAFRITGEEMVVLPVVSTADLRASDIDAWDDRGRLTVGIVLFNPEPVGGDARRVTLPVQVLFPALRERGQSDLVREFEQLGARRRETDQPR